MDANNIDAADVDINVMRHAVPVHLRPEHRVLKYQILRHHSRLENVASAVHVSDVEVERLDPLFEAAAQEIPLSGRQDARQNVEGDQALLDLGLAVNGEGNSDAAKQKFGLAAAVVEDVRWDFDEPTR